METDENVTVKKAKMFFLGFLSKIQICAILQETYPEHDNQRVKVKGWEKIYLTNTNEKKTVTGILTLDKGDHKSRRDNKVRT